MAPVSWWRAESTRGSLLGGPLTRRPPDGVPQSTPVEGAAEASTVNSGFADQSASPAFTPEVMGASGEASGEDPWAAWGGAPPGAGAAGAGAGISSGLTLELFEKMLDDPGMSQMLLPQVHPPAPVLNTVAFVPRPLRTSSLVVVWAAGLCVINEGRRRLQLPEGMRDPAMIKTLLKQPEYRKMLEQSFEQMNTGQMDPQMMASMQQGMNGNPEWQNQFDQVRWRAPLSVEWTILVPPPTFAG